MLKNKLYGGEYDSVFYAKQSKLSATMPSAQAPQPPRTQIGVARAVNCPKKA